MWMSPGKTRCASRKCLLQFHDGYSKPVTDLIWEENHNFTVVPTAKVQPELSWRRPVFETVKCAIALDDAALLPLEHSKRASRKCAICLERGQRR